MLPWLFVVLVFLNAGLFFWGYQREKSLEPPPTPVPEGRYEIRLIGEAPADSGRALDADVLEATVAEEPAVGREAGGANVVGSTAAEESSPLNEEAPETAAVATEVEPALDVEQNPSEPASMDVQVSDNEPKPEDAVAPPEDETSAPADQAMQNEVTGPSDASKSTILEPNVEAPVGNDLPEPAMYGDSGSVDSPEELSAQIQEGLRTDELEVKAPAIPVDGGGTRSSAPPVAPGLPSEDQVGPMPASSSEDGR